MLNTALLYEILKLTVTYCVWIYTSIFTCMYFAWIMLISTHTDILNIIFFQCFFLSLWNKNFKQNCSFLPKSLKHFSFQSRQTFLAPTFQIVLCSYLSSSTLQRSEVHSYSRTSPVLIFLSPLSASFHLLMMLSQCLFAKMAFIW